MPAKPLSEQHQNSCTIAADLPYRLALRKSSVVERVRCSKNDISHEKIKRSSCQKIGQWHKILAYYWISREYGEKLVAAVLLVLMVLRYPIQLPHSHGHRRFQLHCTAFHGGGGIHFQILRAKTLYRCLVFIFQLNSFTSLKHIKK